MLGGRIEEKKCVEKRDSSHAGNRTPATAVRAPDPIPLIPHGTAVGGACTIMFSIVYTTLVVNHVNNLYTTLTYLSMSLLYVDCHAS